MTTRLTHSSGNVFADLGFDHAEALVFRLRSDLVIELRRLIRERNLKQEEAAELFEVTQPRISDLVRGQVAKFSLDTLVQMLGKAGIDINISFGAAEICEPVIQDFESPVEMAAFEPQSSWLPAQKDLGPNTPIRSTVASDYATAA